MQFESTSICIYSKMGGTSFQNVNARERGMMTNLAKQKWRLKLYKIIDVKASDEGTLGDSQLTFYK